MLGIYRKIGRLGVRNKSLNNDIDVFDINKVI